MQRFGYDSVRSDQAGRSRHPDVPFRDVAVISSPDEEAGEVPKAFVVRRGDVSSEELMAWVAQRVPPQKKIRRLEFIDAIPKSAAGKVLRRVLVAAEREKAKRNPLGRKGTGNEG